MTRGRQLTHDLIGCWVVKANPETWNYLSALEDEEAQGAGQLRERNWTMGGTYRTEMMARGDPVVLWVTGRTNPGIYEVGRVTGEASEVDGMDPAYAVDIAKASQTALAVPFESALVEPPVPREDLKTDPALAACEQFRIPQMSNPTFLTPDEASALGRHLDGRLPRSLARKLGWDVYLQ